MNTQDGLGRIVWLTGLSGSGKTTISDSFANHITSIGKNVYRLDGDVLRSGLNRDLTFSHKDRKENIRRAAEVAYLFYKAGFIVICSFISPYETDRKNVRSLFPDGHFFEVYLKCSLQECAKRDPKGLYRKAAKGEIFNFTGIGDVYEIPKLPDLVLDTENISVDGCVSVLSETLCKVKHIDGEFDN